MIFLFISLCISFYNLPNVEFHHDLKSIHTFGIIRIQLKNTTYSEQVEGFGPMKLQQPTFGKVLIPTRKR